MSEPRRILCHELFTPEEMAQLGLNSNGTFIVNSSSQTDRTRETGISGGQEEIKTEPAYDNQMLVLLNGFISMKRKMTLVGENTANSRLSIESGHQISYSVKNPKIAFISDLGHEGKVFNIPGTITTVCTTSASTLQFNYFETCDPWLIALLDGNFPADPASHAIKLLQALTSLESSCDSLLQIISPQQESKEEEEKDSVPLELGDDPLVDLVKYIKDVYIQSVYNKFPHDPAQVQDGADSTEIDVLIALLNQLDGKDPVHQPRSLCERLCCCFPRRMVNNPELSEPLKTMVLNVSPDTWQAALRKSIQTAEQMVIVLELPHDTDRSLVVRHPSYGSNADGDGNQYELETLVDQPKSFCECICGCFPRTRVDNRELYEPLHK